MAEVDVRLMMKKAIPRVLKAAMWGSLTYIFIYYLPLILFPSETIPVDYAPVLLDFVVIVVFFAVVGELFSGTILGYGFSVARAIVIIAYFFAVSESGVFSVTLPTVEVPVKLTIDASILLLMIISVNLLDIVRNILQAITLLTEKSAVIDLT